jgi:S-adenosylmethionine:tRNA ribosyltransferase-isomerase
MLRSEFHYDLPPELIAQEPRERGTARMMVVRGGGIEHRSFPEFPSLLHADDVLVLNDTRVFPARLMARPTGNMQRPIELLLVKRLQSGQGSPPQWNALARPARRVKAGTLLQFSEDLAAEVIGKGNDGLVTLRFDAREEEFWAEVERIGAPPLPPYIRREEAREEDRERYQTVFARSRGAVAAPTAGLHFTEAILREIEQRGIDIVRITLHVGIGTFRPVKVDDIREHRMDSEWYSVSGEAAERLNRAKSIVAVGTTSVRTLESAIRAGGGRFVAGEGETDLFITPGFEFRAVDRLLTNFHLPESTLLMLVSAFAGMETIRAAYREAIAERYLFYSYGDCMLLERRQNDER